MRDYSGIFKLKVRLNPHSIDISDSNGQHPPIRLYPPDLAYLIKKLQELEKKIAVKAWPDKSLIGTKVRRGNSVRTIVSLYDGIPGGVRLNKQIDGLSSWNMDELEMVEE